MSTTALETETAAREDVLAEIARSEAALSDLLHRAERLHTSRIQHDAGSCLLCFSG